jgi:hypothetical protein
VQVSLSKSMESLLTHTVPLNAKTEMAPTAPRSSTITRPSTLTSACLVRPKILALLTGVHLDSQLSSRASGGTVTLMDTKN